MVQQVHSERYAHKKPKMIGEALRTKGRNHMESNNIKEREVAMKRRRNPWRGEQEEN